MAAPVATIARPTPCAPVRFTRHFTAPCRRLGAGRVRRHARAVHRHRRGRRAAASCAARARAGSPPSTACCRARRTRARAREAARGKQTGRTQEIQRLIGRSLRAVVDLARARRAHGHARLRRAAGRRRHAHRRDHRRLRGARRCAATRCARGARSAASPLHGQVAAVSVGIVGGVPVLDLDYAEDSQAETDMNVVMNNGGALHRGAGHGRGPRLPAPRARCAAEPRRGGHRRAVRAAGAGAGGLARRARPPLHGRRWCSPPRNPGKQREFAALLAPRGFELVLQSELGIAAAEETGATFEPTRCSRRATPRAIAGLPALADDSGLEVDALGRRARACTRRAMPAPAASDAAQQRAAARGARGRAAGAAHARAIAACSRCVRGADDPRPLIGAGQLGGTHRAAARAAAAASATTRCSSRRDCDCTAARAAAPARQERAQPPRRRRCASPGGALDSAACDGLTHAAAGAVRALSLVRAQVPVLRLQLARAAAASCRQQRLPRGAAARSGRAVPRGAAGREIISVFLGGGTPSLFPPGRHRRGCSSSCARRAALRRGRRDHARGQSRHDRARPLRRTTAPPASTACRSARRASSPRSCERLGRIHSADETRRAAEELHAAGLDNFNLDLMYALPEQDARRRARRRRAALRTRSRRTSRTTS